MTGVPECENLFPQGHGADSQCIRLSGGVDICQDDLVSEREGGGEFVYKRLGSRVSVGLEDTPDFFVRVLRGGV